VVLGKCPLAAIAVKRSAKAFYGSIPIEIAAALLVEPRAVHVSTLMSSPMAKPNTQKNQPKIEATEASTTDPKKLAAASMTDAAPTEVDSIPSGDGPMSVQSLVPGSANPLSGTQGSSSGTQGKKDSAVNRNKKAAAAGKGSSLTLSQHKLDHLKAAVAAAGSVDNLLVILQHVDEAGGRHEVAESVEAYRALKLALE
jgi:hypothetical protein